MKEFIAERRLLYALKGSDIRQEFVVRLGTPYLVQEGMVNFSVGEEGCWGCHVEIEGLDEKYSEVYGADSLQAINLASNVEPFLKRLQKKYDLFFPSGESYFDDPVT
jgi:hypothetical protein